MTKTKWVVFDEKGTKLKTVTIKHADNRLYRELEPFEKEITDQGLFAQRAESFNKDYLKGKSFKQKLECLGWTFDSRGHVI